MSQHPLNAQEYAQKIVSSREVYEEFSRKESEVWGSQLVKPQWKEVSAREQEAAKQLRINEGKFGFVEWAKKQGLHFERGLSVGCGAGRSERRFVQLGVCDRFHGVDIAEDAVEDARRTAAELGYACTYECADINFFDFGTEKYDFAVAQTSLHHIVYLEDVIASIKRSLVPGGIFHLIDYVGESQFQHSDLRISIANDLLKEIPDEFKFNHLSGQTVNAVTRKKPGTLISPFEGVRSGEIIDIAERHFERIAGGVTTSILHLVCPHGTRSNYLKDEVSIALFRSILLLDRMLIQQGILTGVTADLVYRKEG